MEIWKKLFKSEGKKKYEKNRISNVTYVSHNSVLR